MAKSMNRQRSMRGRLFLLLALVMILAAVNALYPLAANWQAVLSGDPGEVLFAAGFDGFEDEWQQYDGRNSARIESGLLRISTSTSGAYFSSAAPLFRDFDVRVTVNTTGGSPENEGVGIVFRLQEPHTSCDRGFILACGLADLPLVGTPARLLFSRQDTGAQGYYVFLISTDGYYSVWRSDENSLLEKATVWHYSDGLIHEGLNVENTIQIKGQGSRFRFFINDQQVLLCIPLPGEQPTGNATDCMGQESLVWEDSAIETGHLGLLVHADQLPGTVAEFDNLIVISPALSDEEASQL